MKMKNLSLICALSITVLVAASGFAQEVNTMSAQAKSAMDIPDFVGDIVDPSFGRYVNFDAITVAWANQDPALLTDCALELAEAERILFRELRTLTSGALLNKAIMLAADQKDVETLDRVIRYATAAKKDDLLAAATSAKRLAGEERVILPFFTIDLLSMPVQNYSQLKSLIYDINKERANGNKALLVTLADAIAKHAELNKIFKKAEIDALIKYVQASEKSIVESDAAAKATENTLNRLAGEERDIWSHTRDSLLRNLHLQPDNRPKMVIWGKDDPFKRSVQEANQRWREQQQMKEEQLRQLRNQQRDRDWERRNGLQYYEKGILTPSGIIGTPVR